MYFCNHRYHIFHVVFLPFYSLFSQLQIQTVVNDYKQANSSISNDCRKISEMLLVRIDGKKVYENLEVRKWKSSP